MASLRVSVVLLSSLLAGCSFSNFSDYIPVGAATVGAGLAAPAGPAAAAVGAAIAGGVTEAAIPKRRAATNEYEAGVQKTETIVDGVVDLSIWAIILLILVPWLIGLFMPQAKMFWRKK